MKAIIPLSSYCPMHHCEGILLVDIKTETHPYLDAHHHLLYHCLAYGHTFTGQKFQGGRIPRALTRPVRAHSH